MDVCFEKVDGDSTDSPSPHYQRIPHLDTVGLGKLVGLGIRPFHAFHSSACIITILSTISDECPGHSSWYLAI